MFYRPTEWTVLISYRIYPSWTVRIISPEIIRRLARDTCARTSCAGRFRPYIRRASPTSAPLVLHTPVDIRPSTHSHPTGTRTRTVTLQVSRERSVEASGGKNIVSALRQSFGNKYYRVRGRTTVLDVRHRRQMCRRNGCRAVEFFVKFSTKIPSKLVQSDRRTTTRRTRQKSKCYIWFSVPYHRTLRETVIVIVKLYIRSANYSV